MRIHRRRASPLEGRHSPASSRHARNLSTRTGWRQREKTSTPILGNTPPSPRSILTAIFRVSFQGERASRSALVSPCHPMAAKPSGISSHEENMITRRITLSSPRLVMVPICLTKVPSGSLSNTRSKAGRSFSARISPKKAGRNSSHALTSSGSKPVLAKRQGVISPPSMFLL